jgi:hypothetical protein
MDKPVKIAHNHFELSTYQVIVFESENDMERSTFINTQIIWLLFNANSAFFHLYHGEKRLIFNEIMMRSALYYTNILSWIFIMLTHWNSLLIVIDMSPHSDTLSWFRDNQSLLFVLNAACLAEKQ